MIAAPRAVPGTDPSATESSAMMSSPAVPRIEPRAYSLLRALHEYARDVPEEVEAVTLPLNLGLNDGTYMPEACVRMLDRHCHRAALRNYPTASNEHLRRAIAEADEVGAENVFLHHGSGPILKQVVPEIIRENIKRSPWRIARHLLSKNGYPIITPLFTYGKVPGKAADQGLTVRALPTGPDVGFRVRPEDVEAELRRQPGFVYVVNPNNPTGNVMIERDELEPLIAAHPESTFWIDEAYVQYCDEGYRSFAPLVPRYPNLLVSRTFSFAWGLAGMKVGYLLASPERVAIENRRLTDYRIGKLAEDLCVAALSDADHLPWLRRVCARERDVLTQGLARHGVEVFPSVTNFLLCRFNDGRTGADLKRRLAERQIHIKVLSPFAGTSFDAYFRVTLGLAHENRYLLEAIDQVYAEG